MPARSSSTFRFSTAPPSKAGWRRIRPDPGRTCSPCSISCCAMWHRRRSRRGRCACSARSSKPTRIWAASSPDAFARARSGPTRSSRCWIAAAAWSRRAASPKCWRSAGSSAPEVVYPLPAQPIDPPTLAMAFRVNDSPLAGTEGDKVTSRMIRERLLREAEGNVALRIEEAADKDSFEVAGRGELQLAILIETMRREGFELGMSRPKVLFERGPGGELEEPIEEVTIDVDEEFSGIVVQKLSERRAELVDLRPSGGRRLRLVFHAPTRGLIGYQGELLSDTRGTAVLNRVFHAYAPYKGEVEGRRTGVLISNGDGQAVAYALWNLEDRGPMMIEPGTRVYRGMIVGEHSRGNDLAVNVLKGKKLTNIRAAGKDENVLLTPPLRMTLEKALAYIADDELVEVTPKSIRLRKKLLDESQRRRQEIRDQKSEIRGQKQFSGTSGF